MDEEFDYLREKAYIVAEKEHQYKLDLKEEFELKPAKIEVKQIKTKQYVTESTKSINV